MSQQAAEARALFERLIAVWCAMDGFSPDGQRVRRLVARAWHRYERRLYL